MGITVKEVAERVGLPSRTIRYYDSIGLVRADERSDAGYRLYGPEEEGRLLFIRRAKRLGFSLDDIRGLMTAAESGCGATVPELDRLLEQKIEEIDATIADLETFRDRLNDYRAGKRLSERGCCADGGFCSCLDDVPEPWDPNEPEVMDMPCQCGTTAVAGYEADSMHSGCECATDPAADCACGSGGGGVDAGIDQRSLERVVMELDKRVRKLEASRGQ